MKQDFKNIKYNVKIGYYTTFQDMSAVENQAS